MNEITRSIGKKKEPAGVAKLPDVCLGPMRDEHRAEVAELVAEVRAEPQIAAFLCAHKDHSAADADCAVVAVQSGLVIGVAIWAQDETIGVVTDVVVRPDRRRFGVASALLSFLVDRLRNDGLTLLEATVCAQLPGACRLFEGAGFREVDRAVFSGETRVHFERYLLGRRIRKSRG